MKERVRMIVDFHDCLGSLVVVAMDVGMGFEQRNEELDSLHLGPSYFELSVRSDDFCLGWCKE